MKLTKSLWFLSAGAAAAILTGIAILMIWDWLKDLVEWSSEINWCEPTVAPGEEMSLEQYLSLGTLPLGEELPGLRPEMAAYQCGDDLPCPHCGDGACR